MEVILWRPLPTSSSYKISGTFILLCHYPIQLNFSAARDQRGVGLRLERQLMNNTNAGPNDCDNAERTTQPNPETPPADPKRGTNAISTCSI
eukprot:5851764-Amphidinium_carterae.1